MRAEQQRQQADIKYDITWHTLAEGLDTLVAHGISPTLATSSRKTIRRSETSSFNFRDHHIR
jgi:hypothetical protein